MNVANARSRLEADAEYWLAKKFVRVSTSAAFHFPEPR
jgi:hypothetical protein